MREFLFVDVPNVIGDDDGIFIVPPDDVRQIELSTAFVDEPLQIVSLEHFEELVAVCPQLQCLRDVVATWILRVDVAVWLVPPR